MSLIFKSVDTMKASRDMNPALSNSNIVAHINALVKYIPDLTHITVDSYQNNFGFYSITKINEWFDAVHAAGKKVFFRPALTDQMPTYAVDGDLATTWEDYLVIFKASVHNFNWADGDAWDVIPESGITSAFYNTKYGLGNPASWNAGIREWTTELQAEFVTIGKSVDCTFWSGTDQQAIFQTQLEETTATQMGKVCIDFYPMDYIGSAGHGTAAQKVRNCLGQLSMAHNNYPNADIYITEIGYNNTTLVSDDDQREVIRFFLNELRNVSYVKGINYWHASGDTAFDKCLLFESQSLTTPRPALKMLGDFYTNGICNKRLSVL